MSKAIAQAAILTTLGRRRAAMEIEVTEDRIKQLIVLTACVYDRLDLYKLTNHKKRRIAKKNTNRLLTIGIDMLCKDLGKDLGR